MLTINSLFILRKSVNYSVYLFSNQVMNSTKDSDWSCANSRTNGTKRYVQVGTGRAVCCRAPFHAHPGTLWSQPASDHRLQLRTPTHEQHHHHHHHHQLTAAAAAQCTWITPAPHLDTNSIIIIISSQQQQQLIYLDYLHLLHSASQRQSMKQPKYHHLPWCNMTGELC